MDFFNVLTCIGGIAFFLFGMTYMSDALKKTAGNQMKNFLTKMTASPVRGFSIGLLVTMVIQSSTATNVMAVSFVNSGMMVLGQAVPLMIGSNLGTTVTAWLISLSSIDGAGFLIQMLKPASFTCILALIAGIFLYFGLQAKREGDIYTRQTQIGTEVAERLTEELPAQFKDVPEAQKAIEAIIARAQDELLADTDSGAAAADPAAETGTEGEAK